jgi:hypothetical protein
MKNSVFVQSLAEVDSLEDKIYRAGQGLALELVLSCRRYLDKWNTCSNRERLVKFLDEINDAEIGYHPMEPQERISLQRQVELTYQHLAVMSAARKLLETQPGEGAYDVLLEIDPENPSARKRMFLSLLKEDETTEDGAEESKEETCDVEI